MKNKWRAFLVSSLTVLLSTKAGATAGVAGSLLSAGVMVGQVPVPEGASSEQVALYLAIGPFAAWLFARIVAMSSVFALAVRDNARRRALALEALPHAERPKNAEALIVRLHDRADLADAVGRGLETWRLPASNSGPVPTVKQ